MKYLVICSPIIKFLINKYGPNLPHVEDLANLVRKFNAQEILLPEESVRFIKVLADLENYLIANNLMYRIDPIRKLIGNGHKWTGLLNILLNQKEEVYLYSYEPNCFQNCAEYIQKVFGQDNSNVRIIAPLNLEENEEVYTYLHDTVKLPFYPFFNSKLTSKWLLVFNFAPYVPKTFYFPSETRALDYIEKIQRIAKNDNVKYVFLKDEYDTDLSPMLPYAVTPIEKLDYYCALFYEKAQGISNIGGLIIQEFIETNKIIEIYKTHTYARVIPGGDLHYKIVLKPYENGVFFNTVTESPTEELTTQHPLNIGIINNVVAQYYPFVLASIEYIIQNNQMRVIDINGVSRTLSKEKDLDLLPVDNILKNFISSVAAEKNEDLYAKQLKYRNNMQHLYQELRNLGPGYISGERFIKLSDESEHDVKKLRSELFSS
jgi:hypothetical protein